MYCLENGTAAPVNECHRPQLFINSDKRFSESPPKHDARSRFTGNPCGQHVFKEGNCYWLLCTILLSPNNSRSVSIQLTPKCQQIIVGYWHLVFNRSIRVMLSSLRLLKGPWKYRGEGEVLNRNLGWRSSADSTNPWHYSRHKDVKFCSMAASST